MVPMIAHTTENKKATLRVTKITPVENNPFLELFSNEENKMTAAALKDYLERN